jgi:hypothetical protein
MQALFLIILFAFISIAATWPVEPPEETIVTTTISTWVPNCDGNCLVSADMRSYKQTYGSRTLYDIQDLE